MKKFALTTLAVMAAVGVLAVQPADAKKVQQDPVAVSYTHLDVYKRQPLLLSAKVNLYT